jgi:hypothetical protein
MWQRTYERLRAVGIRGIRAVGELPCQAIVHAVLLRMQALLLPIKTLVFNGH